MTKAPIRLLDDPGLSDRERALLEAGTSEPPVDYDLGAGLARFRNGIAALGATGAAATVAREASAKTTSLFGKISLKLVVAIAAPVVGTGVAIGTVALRQPAPRANDTARPGAAMAHSVATTGKRADEPFTPSPSIDDAKAERRSEIRPSAEQGKNVHRPSKRLENAPRQEAPAPAVEAVAVHLEEDMSANGAPERAEPIPPPKEAPKRAETSSPKEAPKRAETGSPKEAPKRAEPSTPPERTEPSEAVLEMQGIARARALLASDPAAALAALETLRREHPKGFFVEERRALTVLSLARAGNRTAAREQGAAFLKRYPNGPFTDKVRAAMSR